METRGVGASEDIILSFRHIVYITISTRLDSYMQARGIEAQKSFLEKAERWGKQKHVLQTSLVLPYNPQWPLAVPGIH